MDNFTIDQLVKVDKNLKKTSSVKPFTIEGLVVERLSPNILKGLTRAIKNYKMFFISNVGDDSNEGAKDAPFKTFERGLEEAQKYTGVGIVLEFLTEYTHADLERPIVINTSSLGILVLKKAKDNQATVTLPPLYIQDCNVELQKIKLKSTSKPPRLLYVTNRANVTANQLQYEITDGSRTIVECDRNSMVMFKSEQTTNVAGKGNIESFLIVSDNSTCEIDNSNIFWFNGGCTNAIIACHNSSFIRDARWWSQGNGISVPSKCFVVDTYANMIYGDDKKFIKNSTDGTYENSCGCDGQGGSSEGGTDGGHGGGGGDSPHPSFAEVGDIGTPGQPGFGVGLASTAQADKCNVRLVDGGNNPLNEHFGNYQKKDNAACISVFIPPFWLKIGDSSSPRYGKYGSNCLDFKPFKDFKNEQEAHAQNYFMPEGFFNNNEITGFFINKYMCSESDGKYISQENAVPKTNVEAHVMFTNCKKQGEKWNAATIQQVQVLRFISLIQAQYCTSTTNCAWWDGNDVMNFPKGNNNNGTDINDSSVKGVGNSSSTIRTGACTPREKTTHNGQKNGVCDVNGLAYELVWGITSPSANANYNTIYVKKRSTDFAKFTFGLDGATDAFGSETHLLTLYDKMDTGPGLTSTLSERWGNSSNAVLRPYNADGSHRLSAIIPKNRNSTSSSGSNLFGQDYFYKNDVANLVPYWSGSWSGTTGAGIFYSSFSNSRTYYYGYSGVRAAAYGN